MESLVLGSGPEGRFSMGRGAAGVRGGRGSACPGPLMEAKKGIAQVKVGEVLEVLSSDPGTKEDIPLWAKKVGHEFVGELCPLF